MSQCDIGIDFGRESANAFLVSGWRTVLGNSAECIPFVQHQIAEFSVANYAPSGSGGTIVTAPMSTLVGAETGFATAT
jgi:hypothetical protein